MKLVFFGPPGVGKGTHSDRVSREYNIPKISTGDLFREEIKKDTELGNSVKEIIDSGSLVPDDITMEIVKKRLHGDDCSKGFIFDGFPRTINQAEQLEKITQIDIVVNFNLSRPSILERLSGRWTCRKCGDIYHEKHRKPKQEGFCDSCGGSLYQREDQTTEAIEKRLDLYEKQTKPLIDFYRSKGVLVDVDCEGDIEEVSKRIFDAIENNK